MSTVTDGVHARHCCADHGCKYGNDDCPVEKGEVKQEFPCENCTPAFLALRDLAGECACMHLHIRDTKSADMDTVSLGQAQALFDAASEALRLLAPVYGVTR